MKAPVKTHFYSAHATALRTELAAAISRDELQALHRKNGTRHFLIAARQFAILGLATWGLVAFANPFEVTLPTKIQEMTGKPVVRLLAREKDIRDKFNKGQDKAAGFDDVVMQIGAEYGEVWHEAFVLRQLA